jgi:hypothetical protein
LSLTQSGDALGDERMIEPFAEPAWAEAHEKVSAELAAGFGRLVRWLRPDKSGNETCPVTPSPGSEQPQPRTPAD